MSENFVHWLRNQTMTESGRRWSYDVSLNLPDVPVAQSRWCTEQFGDRIDFINDQDGSWDIQWAGQGEWKFRFKREADAVCFQLTWS